MYIILLSWNCCGFLSPIAIVTVSLSLVMYINIMLYCFAVLYMHLTHNALLSIHLCVLYSLQSLPMSSHQSLLIGSIDLEVCDNVVEIIHVFSLLTHAHRAIPAYAQSIS